jgi:hypothetical protein
MRIAETAPLITHDGWLYVTSSDANYRNGVIARLRLKNYPEANLPPLARADLVRPNLEAAAKCAGAYSFVIPSKPAWRELAPVYSQAHGNSHVWLVPRGSSPSAMCRNERCRRSIAVERRGTRGRLLRAPTSAGRSHHPRLALHAAGLQSPDKIPGCSPGGSECRRSHRTHHRRSAPSAIWLRRSHRFTSTAACSRRSVNCMVNSAVPILPIARRGRCDFPQTKHNLRSIPRFRSDQV